MLITRDYASIHIAQSFSPNNLWWIFYTAMKAEKKEEFHKKQRQNAWENKIST